MKKNAKTVLCLLLALLMLSAFVTGCGGSSQESTQGKTEEQSSSSTVANGQASNDLLEYTYYYHDAEASKWANNPNDVVTPYIEKKFNIRVKEVYTPTSQTLREMLNQWRAAGNIPDVLNLNGDDANYAISTGEFAALDDYIKDMPNFNKYMDANYWPIYKTDGEIYQIPQLQLQLNDSKYANDPYNPGMFAWGLWVREDLLSQAGYRFTPVDKIAETTTNAGKRPTADDYKIDPPINTPDDFYTMLKKINDLHTKVGDKPLIPLSITAWQQFHIGSMFDFGQWRKDENGDVEGFLGTPGAKDYYKFLTKLYKEGLIDKDFLIQKPEQLQEKVASGRVACGMQVPDLPAAMQSMAQINPEEKIRYIAWPKQTPGKGFYDVYLPGFYRVIVNKNFKDIKRLTQYFDWFYSDEGMDTITWGPESAGLWEIKDGKRVFKDKEVENDILNGIHGKKGADFYGLYDYTNTERSSYWSKAAMATPCIVIGNPRSYERSYPPKLSALLVGRNIICKSGLDYDGVASYGDGKDNSNAASTYYWNDFVGQKVANLLISKNDAGFDNAWNEIYKEYLTKGKYEAAKEDMKKWYDEYGIKK